MVKLKNKHDQYQVIMWQLTNVESKTVSIESRKQLGDKQLQEMLDKIKKL